MELHGWHHYIGQFEILSGIIMFGCCMTYEMKRFFRGKRWTETDSTQYQFTNFLIELSVEFHDSSMN
jgi:hypothetical protein